MNSEASQSAFVIFLIFCRIGGCVLFAPGLSSARVPVNARLLIAVGMTAAIAPLLHQTIARELTAIPLEIQPVLIVTETVIGAMIGLMGRLYLLALQMAATAASSLVGLSGIPGVPLDEAEQGSILATLASSTAVMLILLLGLEIEMLRAVIDSYDVIRLDSTVPIRVLLTSFVDVLTDTSALALRLAAPFLAYGVIVNIAIGMGNRFAPHISVYHATTGAVMLGGFLLIYLLWQEWFVLFLESYDSWLTRR
ncbi:flagellar biosynthetic protein FliR [Aestuariivirga sp.]|uniref:flagellar biosynthetic protein FliR n=1 Tax=Aestuariivirga sp. TaxID=2650926 RepID=UPI0035930C8B